MNLFGKELSKAAEEMLKTHLTPKTGAQDRAFDRLNAAVKAYNVCGTGLRDVRDYRGTTLELEPGGKGWLWRVQIPPWLTPEGLKATGAPKSGTARTKRRAIRKARDAVLEQMQTDGRTVERRTWDGIGERF